MEASRGRVPVPGSERKVRSGARKIEPADSTEQIHVSVYLRPRRPLDTAADQPGIAPAGSTLSREDYTASFGADPADVTAVESFAREHGLTVDEVDPARRVVGLSGPVEVMQKSFGVELFKYDHPHGSYRGREGPVTVPANLAGVVVGVLGLDDRPAAHPHSRRHPADAAAPHAAGGPYTPVEVATAYNFPTAGDGTGECVAIIELGGGYTDSDLATFFKDNGIAEPTIVSVGVDGAANTPGGDADGEVALDVEIVGAVAPGARIAVYFAPNTDRGFLDAVTTAAHDTANSPSVISISWGSAESGWTGQSMTAMDQAFHAAALMGVTVCVASGDNGSGDAVTDGLAHVDFPASSPNVLGCGGTTLSQSGGKISSEDVWNAAGGATGGGISDVFDVPSYQTSAHVPASANPGNPSRVGRGVPDVAGDADPATGYNVVLGGKTLAFGGTSAVAPLWSGLIARINSAKGTPSGLINPVLYANPTAMHDVTAGNNGAYTARAGWDACTGLGSPDGQLVSGAVTAATPSAR